MEYLQALKYSEEAIRDEDVLIVEYVFSIDQTQLSRSYDLLVDPSSGLVAQIEEFHDTFPGHDIISCARILCRIQSK